MNKKIKISKIVFRDSDRSQKNRLHIFLENESLRENLMLRFSRPYKFYKKEVIPMILERLKKTNPDVYKKIKNSTWNWSQKAGCSCGCSPGFIGSTKDMLNIYVDIK